MLNIYEVFEKLSSVRSQSGREGSVMELIKQIAFPYADDMSVDGMGNLLIHKRGEKGAKKLMIAAHADEIGVVVSHIEKTGYLRFAMVGGISPVNIIGTPIVFANGARGVVHMNDDAKIASIKVTELFIDIGADTREEAQAIVRVGDMGGYDLPSRKLGNKLSSPYLDDKIGCAALLCALSDIDGCKNDVTFAFTVQEEVGCRGAGAAANGVMPDCAVVVDVTSGRVPESQCDLGAELGKGPSSKIMDRSVICAPSMRELIARCAVGKGIAIQEDLMTAGGTDSGNIQCAMSGALVGAISIPARYVHSMVEMVSISDAENTARLLSAIASASLPENVW